jgi:hypothetical protein
MYDMSILLSFNQPMHPAESEAIEHCPLGGVLANGLGSILGGELDIHEGSRSYDEVSTKEQSSTLNVFRGWALIFRRRRFRW